MYWMQIAKGFGITIFIVGRVTKEGNGWTESVEHMVDTVFHFEGDRHASYRILRAVKTGLVLLMRLVYLRCRLGLEEVSNPSEYLLRDGLRMHLDV